MTKIDKLMQGLLPEQRRSVAFYVHRTYGGAMSSTERSQRFRCIERNGGGNENVAPPSNEIVAPERNETVASPVVPRFFLQFWSVYPKKVGKGAATKAWKKLNLENQGPLILDAVARQLAFLNRDGGKFIPNPATWLNENRYEDEPPQPTFLSEKTSGNVDAARAFVEGNRSR